jgi:hypothetical protein
MQTLRDIPPLQRDALCEAIQSPTHALVRGALGFSAAPARNLRNSTGTVRVFSLRLMRMLDRAYLVDLDEPAFPTRATLTSKGRELAEQLVRAQRDAAFKAKAGAA